MPQRSRDQQGFTLIELLIVIAIIAVLAAILIPTFRGAQKRPYDTAALQCGRAMITYQTSSRLENGGFTALVANMGEDVQEACTHQGVRVQPDHTLANNPGASVSNAVATNATNYAFQVFHPNGSGYYIYNDVDGTAAGSTRLNRLIRW